jgi:hypothetical protein
MVSATACRPRLPKDLPGLIRRMAAENPTWGEGRTATVCRQVKRIGADLSLVACTWNFREPRGERPTCIISAGTEVR